MAPDAARCRSTGGGTASVISGKTRREAQTKLRQLLTGADRGVLPSAEKLTVAQHLERWLADVVGPSVRPSTVKGYRTVARLYILPTLGSVKLAMLQASHIQQLYGQLTARGLSPKSVRNAHAVLRHALGQAVE